MNLPISWDFAEVVPADGTKSLPRGRCFFLPIQIIGRRTKRGGRLEEKPQAAITVETKDTSELPRFMIMVEGEPESAPINVSPVANSANVPLHFQKLVVFLKACTIEIFQLIAADFVRILAAVAAVAETQRSQWLVGMAFGFLLLQPSPRQDVFRPHARATVPILSILLTARISKFPNGLGQMAQRAPFLHEFRQAAAIGSSAPWLPPEAPPRSSPTGSSGEEPAGTMLSGVR